MIAELLGVLVFERLIPAMIGESVCCCVSSVEPHRKAICGNRYPLTSDGLAFGMSFVFPVDLLDITEIRKDLHCRNQ
jgi:hypothetical protein